MVEKSSKVDSRNNLEDGISWYKTCSNFFNKCKYSGYRVPLSRVVVLVAGKRRYTKHKCQYS